MTVTLEPFTAADIPSAINVHTSSLAETPSQGQKDLRTEEWNLALENPFAKIVKATEGDRLIGAAGFLTHEVNGLQWTAPERKASAGTVEKEVNEELAEARDEVLQGDYDLWHIYHVFLSPSFESSSTWSDMITWGLSQADAAGKRVYVQASSTEKRKYEKLGFELKKVEERGERYLMLRPAKV